MMKRLAALLLVLLMSSYAAPAENFSDYEQVKEELLEEFIYGDYSAALDIYRSICEQWPKATDRKGNIDLFGTYCEARVAMDNLQYTEAIYLFSALDGSFPANDSNETAGDLLYYCKGQRYLVTGLTDKAIVCFMQCRNTLDSTKILARIKSGETTIEDVSAILTTSDSAAIMWTDVAANDGVEYCVTYYPQEMVSKAKIIKETDTYALLDDLIPGTDYTVSVTPLTDGKISGTASECVTFATKAAPVSNSGVKITDAIIYQYNREHREKLNYGRDKDVFIEKVINESSSIRPYYTALGSGSDMMLSGAGIELSTNGYAVRYKFKYTRKEAGTLNAMVVLRPADIKTGNSEDDISLSGVYTKSLPIESDMGQGSFCLYLDDMLAEMYEFNENQWPYGKMILELYINGSLEKSIWLNMTMES